MARAYDIAIAALALGVERKWLDNLTSQHRLSGTEHVARGVARRLTMNALLSAAIVRDLNRDLGVSVTRAVELAAGALADSPREVEDRPDVGGLRPVGDRGAPVRAVISVGNAVTLAIDIERVRLDIEHRLIAVMETVVPRRRGRPSRKERRGTR